MNLVEENRTWVKNVLRQMDWKYAKQLQRQKKEYEGIYFKEVKMEKSKGHICFKNKDEYFKRNKGIYRASINRPVMPDGYRCGRWEYPEHMENKISEGNQGNNK